MRAAISVVFVLGCSSESSSPPPAASSAPKVVAPAPKKSAPAGKWMSSTLRLSGADLPSGAELHVSVIAGKLELRPVRVPIGTVLEIGGSRFETKKKFDRAFEVPLDAALAEIPWAQLKPADKHPLGQPVDLELSIALTLPNAETLLSPLPPLLVTTRLDALFSPDKAWPGEGAAAKPPAAAAWTVNGFEALGTAEKVRDVRFIVTGTKTENTRTRRCSGYLGARDFTATSYDISLSIVDRQTKQPVATKKFQGQPACPSTVITSGRSGPSHAEGPSMAAMRRWVTGEVTRLAK